MVLVLTKGSTIYKTTTHGHYYSLVVQAAEADKVDMAVMVATEAMAAMAAMADMVVTEAMVHMLIFVQSFMDAQTQQEIYFNSKLN